MASISPDEYLARIGGHTSSPAYELAHAVHRLYINLAYVHDMPASPRMDLFRAFVRLVVKHRKPLLRDALLLGIPQHTELCTLCRDRNAKTPSAKNCCFYRADARATGVLSCLRRLADREDAHDPRDPTGTALVEALCAQFARAKLAGDCETYALLEELWVYFSHEDKVM